MTLRQASSRSARILAAAALVSSLALAGDHALFTATSVAQNWTVEELIAQGPPSQTGGVVITEFMKDPSSVADTRGEWVELYNNLPWRVNVEGWILADDSGSQVVLQNGGLGLRIPAGQYLVVGNNADPLQNGGVNVASAYSSFVLGNGADQIELRKPNGIVVDRVDYDDGIVWPDQAGHSIALTGALHDAFSNDDGTQWCASANAWTPSNTDTGTPGMPNDVCP